MNNQYQLVCDYKHNDELRSSFNELSEKTFGLNFEKWYQDGYWNDSYICYSYRNEDNKIVSNISIHPMDIMMNGEHKKAIQIGTVMTDENHRKQGLARKLMEHIISTYKEDYDLFYLSANETVLDFYPRFGFKLKEETKFILPVSTSIMQVRKGVRQLELSNDADLAVLIDLTENRYPASNTLDTFNDHHLVRFYCTNVFTDSIYYIEKENSIVVFNIEGNTLHLLGVISDREVDLNKLVTYLVSNKIKQIEFHFTPDIDSKQLTLNKTSQNDRFILNLANIELPQDYVFPSLSQG
ncbi:GNAT family N-acetyltransferase [Haloplasma contractile]|uniref:Acetyltransferase protein n=1 Tax=Haloplasma contractile SSD-17B TaxID=1033810 RepID=F7Q0R2_9MOLU|nr:GNAT family N-acetyltransferase [Haloplasma contractile]ERJ11972.1 putative acetyltransferase protein [Haloplasma contractile SSD-17B]